MVTLPCDISVLKLFHVEQLQTPLDEIYQRKKQCSSWGSTRKERDGSLQIVCPII